jgi:hypothetical protein
VLLVSCQLFAVIPDLMGLSSPFLQPQSGLNHVVLSVSTSALRQCLCTVVHNHKVDRLFLMGSELLED